MPINIADQFKVNVALPIDSRIVASGSSARTAIQFKYDGLRVFDTSNRITYVWNPNISPSGDWVVADINGVGQANYMTRWSSLTGLTSSGIYYTSVGPDINKGNVGINTSSPQAVLQINSNSGLSQPFVIHKGVSTLLASNFYNDGTDKSFTPGIGSGAIRFSDSGSIDFLTRSAGAPAINSGNDNNLAFQIQSGTGWAYLFKNLILSGNTTVPVSSLFLRSQNTFSEATTSANKGPDIAWYDDDNTGIFHPAKYQIGFSIGGYQRARLTVDGLLIGGEGGGLVVPRNKLHLDSGNGAASYIQFTSGSTTGTGAASGFLVGVNTSGYPVLQSGNNFPVSTTFGGGKYRHKLEPNSFTIYSDSSGVALTDIIGFNATRVMRSTNEKYISASSLQNLLLIGFSVPLSSLCSLEITFVTILKITSGGSIQYKTQKLLISFSVASNGTITHQNNGGTAPFGGNIGDANGSSGHDIKTLTSSSAANIGKGYLSFGSSYIYIYQQVGLGLVSTAFTARTVIDHKLIVNKL